MSYAFYPCIFLSCDFNVLDSAPPKCSHFHSHATCSQNRGNPAWLRLLVQDTKSRGPRPNGQAPPEGLQRGNPTAFRQPVPLLWHRTAQQCCLVLRGSPLCSSLCPLPLPLALGTTEKNMAFLVNSVSGVSYSSFGFMVKNISLILQVSVFKFRWK